jgi:hypothetical protein
VNTGCERARIGVVAAGHMILPHANPSRLSHTHLPLTSAFLSVHQPHFPPTFRMPNVHPPHPHIKHPHPPTKLSTPPPTPTHTTHLQVAEGHLPVLHSQHPTPPAPSCTFFTPPPAPPPPGRRRPSPAQSSRTRPGGVWCGTPPHGRWGQRCRWHSTRWHSTHPELGGGGEGGCTR